MSTPAIRTRFAPAPTGYLHLGGARTALFNWMFARANGGEFVLRIEDTDTDRSRPELIDVIFRVLDWLGLDADGEPVFQSERADAYADAVSTLLAADAAYWCDCTPEVVKARAEARGGPPGYDSHCADRGLGPGEGRVVRFRVPDEGTTGWDDVVRGPISFANADLEDFVIVRSNGKPLFLVANAVDDAAMGITHVVRGEDLINVTPKVLLLRRALGIDHHPVFAHLPLIVNERRQKLSKRRDDVSVGDYMDRGFLPEAMVNYLALLGWGPPDGVELRPVDELVSRFRLEDVSKAGAMFDVRKLEHFDKHWIAGLSTDDFVARARPWLTGEGDGFVRPPPPPWHDEQYDPEAFAAIAPLVQERVATLGEVPRYVDFLFLEDAPIDPDDWVKVMARGGATTLAVLDAVLPALADCEWDADTLGALVFERAASVGVTSKKKAQAPVRVAALGRAVGPPLWESLVLLGRDRTRARLASVRTRLAAELAAEPGDLDTGG